MPGPGPFELGFAGLVVTLCYAVRGTAGFGGQAFAVPLLALVLPLPVVVSAIVVLTTLASLGHWRDRARIAWREIARLLPFTAAGIVIGLTALDRLDLVVLTRAFGIFVLAYAGFALVMAARPVAAGRMPVALTRAVLGVLAGASGAAFGAAAGPLYAMHFNALRLEKDAFRATVTAILGIQALMRMAGYARMGYYDGAVLTLILAGLPLMILGTYLGHRFSDRLDPRRFQVAIIVLLVVSGVALLLK